MSWGVGAIGKAPAVRKEIARQFAQGSKCTEPEESIRQLAASMLDASLAAQADNTPVRVAGSGSASFEYPPKTGDAPNPPVIKNNTLTVSVEVLYNFVE